MIVGLLFVLFTKCNQYINNNNLVTCCKNTHQSLLILYSVVSVGKEIISTDVQFVKLLI